MTEQRLLTITVTPEEARYMVAVHAVGAALIVKDTVALMAAMVRVGQTMSSVDHTALSTKLVELDVQSYEPGTREREIAEASMREALIEDVPTNPDSRYSH